MMFIATRFGFAPFGGIASISPPSYPAGRRGAEDGEKLWPTRCCATSS